MHFIYAAFFCGSFFTEQSVLIQETAFGGNMTPPPQAEAMYPENCSLSQ